MRRQIVIRVLLFATFVTTIFVLSRLVTLEALIRDEDRLRLWIDQAPLRAWPIGFSIYFLVSLIPGTSGKSVVCGWLFGFWPALLMVDGALSLAALVMYFIARTLMQTSAESRLGQFRNWVQRRLDQDGSFYLLGLRMAHAPFTVVNYSCGALSVRVRTFLWTTAIGLLPGSMICVFVGTRLPTLRELHHQGPFAFVDPSFVAAFVGVALLPLGTRAIVRRCRSSHRTRPSSCGKS